MAYTKQNWVDDVTPVDAEHLKHMEEGIEAASNATALTIGTVTAGETASATITDGKLNLVLVNGKDGAQGPAGEQGPAGADGQDGAPGTPGQDGAPGKNGATWYTVASAQSAGASAPEGAVEGDYVLDANGEVYKVNASSQLDDTTVNLKGTDGATYTLPDATTSARGGVLQATAQADTVATDASTLATDFNALLARLRTAGILATE